ncbi:hypothetical protein ACXYMX_07505 [Sporosarcina sp. CAU 1771]
MRILDYILIVFTGLFAINRLVNGEYFIAFMFGLLCALNIVSAVVKRRRANEAAGQQK